MRDKIEINGVVFNLSNVPNYFMNTYQYGFTLICTNIELSTIKQWCVMQDVFYFEPFDNDVIIEQRVNTNILFIIVNNDC